MANGIPDPAAKALLVACPSCKSKFRVAAVEAQCPIRCPACGALARLSRPQPKTNEPSHALEGSPPATPRKGRRPPEEDLGPSDGQYEVGGREERTPSAPFLADNDEVPQRARLRKQRSAPETSLVRGVYTFPWQPQNLRAWFLFSFGFTLVAIMGAACWHVIQLYKGGPDPTGVGVDTTAQNVYFRILILYVKGFVLFLLWTGTYAASYFLSVIQETAAGGKDTGWPDDTLTERLFRFFSMFWFAACAACPGGIVAAVLRQSTAVIWLAGACSLLLVFPLALLSSLANGSMWMIWNGQLLGGLARKPHVLLYLYIASTIVLLPSVLLGYGTIGALQYYLAPFAGLAWSAGVLIYGRLLGRVSAVVIGDDMQANSAGARRRKRA